MNFRELLKSKHTRKIRVFFALGILLLCIPQAIFAHVYGSEGLAPTLPSNVPGIERPFPQDEEKFTFAIIGDKTGGGEENWPIFDQAIDEINRLHPDFAIMVGDLIQGFDTQAVGLSRNVSKPTQPKGYITDLKTIDEQWNQFYEHANRIQVPLFLLPGNHDISNKMMYDYWNANIGKTYYSFDYKGCYFILLNTEEGKWADEVQFGSEQMEWLRADIPAHRQKKHLFIFMHQPAWYYSGEEFAQWETIESWLEGLPYTVFAGHFHNLTYETRKGHRYFVLSTTGGSLWPSEVLELGAFHHYTLVTVDGQDVHTAIIQPGNAPPYGIAQREFGDKAHQLFSWEKHFPLVQGLNEGKLIVHLNNTFEKTVSMKLKYSPSNGSSWDFAPREVKYVIQPGKKAEIVLKASYDFENLLPLPSVTYDISYGDARLWQSSEKIVPGEHLLTPIRQWMVVGPFDLGIQSVPSSGPKLETAPPRFVQALEPEKNWDITQTYPSDSNMITWQEAETEEEGWVNFDSIYGGDYGIAYGLCYIYAPDDQEVFAAFKCDALSKIFVKGEEVYSAGFSFDLNYFMLPLTRGWNAVLVKCADYAAKWGYTLKVADLNKELKFANRRP